MRALSLTAVAVATIALTGLVALPAHADVQPNQPQTQPVSASVIGGGLSAAISGPTNPLTVTLDGSRSLSATSPAGSLWTIVDARGTGAAWGLSVSGTDFVSAAGDTDKVERTLPIGDLSISPGTITSVAGSSVLPTAGSLAISGTSQVLVTAAADAKGSFTFTPDFGLNVAGTAYRSNFTNGTSGAVNLYESTLTFTIA
jgi:hypothetical protein